MAARADFELHPPMDLLLQFLGGHVFHLFQQFGQFPGIGPRQFRRRHCGHLRVGEDVNPHHIMLVRSDRITA